MHSVIGSIILDIKIDLNSIFLVLIPAYTIKISYALICFKKNYDTDCISAALCFTVTSILTHETIQFNHRPLLLTTKLHCSGLGFSSLFNSTSAVFEQACFQSVALFSNLWAAEVSHALNIIITLNLHKPQRPTVNKRGCVHNQNSKVTLTFPSYHVQVCLNQHVVLNAAYFFLLVFFFT